MADSGIYRVNPLQGWQRDAIAKAASVLRETFGNPPSDPKAKLAHDALLEVLDPVRRTARLQKELSEATRKATLVARAERRASRGRRAGDRRTTNLARPAGAAERRKDDRRRSERRSRG